jgi:hypothetical protein
MGRSDGLLTHIALDFESKSLMVRADGEDDTVEICSIDSPRSERLQENDASNVYPWENLIGQEFGWGWVTVNQQGYLWNRFKFWRSHASISHYSRCIRTQGE